MKEIELKLLQILKDSNEPIGTSEMSEMVGVSRSRVKAIVKEINNELEPVDAWIEGKTGLGNGYVLHVEDQEKFDHYLDQVLPETIRQNEGLFSNQDARVNYIIQRFLQTGNFIKADDLAEELSISKNQLSKDLKLVRTKFRKVGIEVINKPYYGLKIDANEIKQRQYLAKMESEKLVSSNYGTTFSGDSDENIILAQLKTIIINDCEKFNYNLEDMTCDNLVTHLYIALKRSEKKYHVNFTPEDKKKIEEEEEFELAKAIIYDIQSCLNVTLSKNEIYYCAIHLSSKRALDTEYVVSSEIQKMVSDMLKYLDEVKGTTFSSDFRLALRLSLHMVPLLSRAKYNLELKNPLLEEIKSRYIVAYDHASVCADYLNKELNTTLSENEISYIALHIQIAMNDQKKPDKKQVLIVCSSGRGSAALLKVRFKQEYEKYIDKVTVSDYLSVKKMDLSEFDYIFSTIPLKDFNHPYLLISHFIDSNDDRNITRVLEGNEDNFYHYFEKDLFMSHINASDREDVIRKMTDNIRKHRTISDEFYESVMKRESLANTCFAKMVAMPHPYRVLGDETFISIGILEKPIEWDVGEMVRIVLLCSFAGNFAKNNEEFFSLLSEIISSEKTIRELSHAEDYETFMKTMKDRLGD
ncbi:MAG: transcription antiterminator [Erysipelotrichaceae bacterium]|nr:transcription antiterminator [Erysipelotrichaceae bacterium]